MISALELTKFYDGTDVPALQNVTFTIEKGEFAFLTGPSGAGKTTLLRLLFGAVRPSSGELEVNRRNLRTLKRRELPRLRREIGVVFQDFKLIPTQSVAENVAYALHVTGMSEMVIRNKVRAILAAVGLVHRANTLPSRLSGGEQQRVAVARALVNDPVVLLADEPTGNLDATLTEEIMDLLEQANARGTTVLVATHDQALLHRKKVRTLKLNAGHLDGAQAKPRIFSPRS